MVKLIKGKRSTGPSSAIGLMRFFDAETRAPKLSPHFIVGAIFVVIAVVLAIRTIF